MIIFIFSFLAFPAGAEENIYNNTGANPWTQTINVENDAFNRTDGNYTNGIKISTISPDLSLSAASRTFPHAVLEYIQKFRFLTTSAPQTMHKIEISIGQNIFTPSDISRSDLIRDDRPYAGWTYLSASYHRKHEEEGKLSFMDTIEIQAGIVGPESFAEETQKFVHRLRSSRIPKGWDNQLKNEPGLALAFERKILLHPRESERFGSSVMAHIGGTVGNVYTYLNSGLELRLGWNIPEDFGVSLIRPAGSTRLEVSKGFSIYVFGALNGRAVIRDIFLDGNSFTDSHSISKNPFVADIAGGLALSYKRIIVTLTQVHRTKEFKGQDKAHRFGAIAISYSFPVDFGKIIQHI